MAAFFAYPTKAASFYLRFLVYPSRSSSNFFMWASSFAILFAASTSASLSASLVAASNSVLKWATLLCIFSKFCVITATAPRGPAPRPTSTLFCLEALTSLASCLSRA